MSNSNVTFKQAIQDGFDNYFNFSGTASRSQFWYWVLFTMIISVTANIIIPLLGDSLLGTVVGSLYLLVILFLFIPNISIAVRRLHDSGMSGWWLLILIIPIVNLITLYFYIRPTKVIDNPYAMNSIGDVDTTLNSES